MKYVSILFCLLINNAYANNEQDPSKDFITQEEKTELIKGIKQRMIVIHSLKKCMKKSLEDENLDPPKCFKLHNKEVAEQLGENNVINTYIKDHQEYYKKK